MGTNPLVSIVIPTYNRAWLILETIESVFNQTYKNYEIIVIDDGSVDDTESVLEPYMDRIQYIKQKNRGVGAARNRAMADAKGVYLAFLDSDDMWDDDKLEIQVSAMEKMPEIAYIFTEFRILKETQTINFGLGTWPWYNGPIQWNEIMPKRIKFSSLSVQITPAAGDFDIYVGSIYQPMLHAPYVLPSTSIVRKEFVDFDIGFTEGVTIYEDWDFYARLTRNHDVAFMNVETTTNRGYKDETRVTFCERIEKTKCRISLLERVWRRDPEFLSEHGHMVDEIEGEQLLDLAMRALLESEVKEARNALKRWSGLNLEKGKGLMTILNVFAHIPFGYKLLILFRAFRRRMKSQ